jgi:hypothetical protein
MMIVAWFTSRAAAMRCRPSIFLLAFQPILVLFRTIALPPLIAFRIDALGAFAAIETGFVLRAA